MSREALLAYARTGISMNKAPSQQEIRDLVGRLADSPLFASPPTDEDREQVAQQLEREFMVDLGPAHILTAEGHKPWLRAKRHEIDFHYWRRYKDHLGQSGFGPRVVNRLDEVTDDILDLAGDPTVPGTWKRRGLVVGHVQSGKTANYVGLINKAADAGYKLIILIAGIHSNLRSQTQERIDEGFVGRDSDQLLGGRTNANFLGVGNLDRSFSAVAYTSRAHDFLKTRADGLGISINNLAQPAIFVIKKNKSILTNLIEWLQGTSTSGDKLTMPMLVIDDEADNASVNTSADPNRPNTINRLIRTLLNISTRNTYIGYTATPFANIFIDPETTDDFSGDDLFPRDFIVGLDAPSNYVGAREFFLTDDEEPVLTVPLDDTDDWLPVSHKIDAPVEDLHASLLDAINCFILSKAIRILRGQGNRHHSMLVNVSRFTGVQGRVARCISEHMSRVRDSIQNRYALSTQSALRDPFMRSLHTSWEEHYNPSSPESWEDIQRILHQAAAGMLVVEVNARSGPGVLDYRSHASTGLNVIAVGGNSLSRGFTLEGLTISYFLRNTQMYDTLLQMGRWFGYRDGFKDLCRLFIKSDALDWYAYIAEATEELRDEIRKMESSGLTPMDFGLAVRSHPGALIVTARNKMRTAEQIVREVGLAGKLVESALVHASDTAVQANWERTVAFIRRLQMEGYSHTPYPEGSSREGSSKVFRNIPQHVALDFISGFALHPGNTEMSTSPLVEYAKRRGFDTWDVVVASKSATSNPDVASFPIEGITVGLQQRSAKLLGREGRKAIVISGDKRRVASRGLEAAGLSTEQREAAKTAWQSREGAKDGNIADHFYREQRSRPLLMLHLLDVRVDGNGPRERHAAYGISFPALRPREEETRVAYTANVVAYRELFGQLDAEGDDDDDADE
jgi:hypothetical protein